MSRVKLNIDKSILAWAIERSGKDCCAYLEQHPKVKEWVDGLDRPTLKQLERFAKELFVPMGYLFLPTPPVETMPIPLFRRINDKLDINVYDTVNELQERQEWLSGYLHQRDFSKVPFVGIHRVEDGIDKVCSSMRRILGLPVNWMMEYSKVDDALRFLTETIENLGVVITYNSVVGFNNKRPIAVEECRGFALVDDYAPFIFVNSRDAKYAQMFTLVHEFAHILTGYSAGLGNSDISSTDITEQFCDAVAAAYLVPENLLKEVWTEVGENYEILSKKLKVSRFVIARCAKDYGLITKEHFFALYQKWKAEPLVHKEIKGSGGDFRRTAIKRVSRLFLIHVSNAVENNALLYMDAFRLTGLKGDTFRKVVDSPFFV